MKSVSIGEGSKMGPHYRLVILQCDGVIKVTSVAFDTLEAAEYHAQLLGKSAGVESVTVEECRPFLTVHSNHLEDMIRAMMG